MAQTTDAAAPAANIITLHSQNYTTHPNVSYLFNTTRIRCTCKHHSQHWCAPLC